MPHSAFFRNTQPLDYSGLARAIESCSIFSEIDCETVKEEWRADIERGGATSLPQFHPEEVEPESLSVTGLLQGETDWEVLGRIFVNGSDDIGRIATLRGSVQFDLKDFADAPGRRSDIYILCEEGILKLIYSGKWGAYTTPQDFKSMRAQFAAVIASADLPIRMVDAGEGFRLEPIGPRSFGAPINAVSVAPLYFNCQTDDSAPAGLVERCERVIRDIADWPSRRVSWGVSQHSPDTAKASTLCRLILEKQWPAASYRYSFRLRLLNLAALEIVRTHTSEKRPTFIPVCKFRAEPKRPQAVLRAMITSKGYYLELQAKDAITPRLVSERLGIPFAPHVREWDGHVLL